MEQPHRRMTDEELARAVVRARDADLRAYDELVLRHQERVLANCYYITRSEQDAEDLAQEVFVKAYYSLPRFEARSQFRTWLQRIKINHCLNHVRKTRGKNFIHLDDPALDAEPSMHVATVARDPSASTTITEAPIQKILESMRDTLRIPLVLSDVDGLPYEEIAQKLGIGISATKMRIKRARAEFRTKYESRRRPNVESRAEAARTEATS